MSETALLEARRMQLRGMVRVASEVLPPFWPMRSFVHHNPLHGQEGLPFHQAVRQGERLFGGRGYLSADVYRAYLRAGRIAPVQLDGAVRLVASDESVTLGGRRISHGEVLRVCLTHGVCEDGGTPDTTEVHDGDEDPLLLARTMTLATWCDRVFGTDIVDCVNEELVKWCEAFLDEGHATWAMPGREQGFYLAWRSLAAREWRPCGIKGSRASIRALPDFPEDAILESLARLGIPDEAHQDYLALELAALPGWPGFIKWRAEQRHDPWQRAYPASLVKYLAVRLWYERELVRAACRQHLGIDGHLASLREYMQTHPDARARCLTPVNTPPSVPVDAAGTRVDALAAALELPAQVLRDAPLAALRTLVGWVDAFTPAEREPVWQRAFEASYQEALLSMLDRPCPGGQSGEAPIRPQSQSVYCLDVRTEPFRRHLEATGDHETFAFAGFFGAAIRFRPWGVEDGIDQVPAVMQPRNEVREVPRSYHEHLVPKHRSRARWLSAGETLLGDLKENVVTPYVMVESLGWLYGVPLVGKTLLPRVFQRLAGWVWERLLPPIPTSLTVDKLSPAEVDEMLAAEQRDAIWKALRDEFGQRGFGLDAHLVEAIRLHALDHPGASDIGKAAEALRITPAAIDGLVQTLRREHHLEARAASRRKERLTRMGFTVEEQVATLDTVLRTIGLTKNFARLVLICGHGSTSENNPYESALDCGACGGNAGSPNARALAMMANNPRVRERLARTGIAIPADTHFVGGLLDTTTDSVRLFDLEDVPPAHRKDVARLQEDLAAAGRLTSEERLARLPDVTRARQPALVWRRSADWSQVRPEWGLSGNAAFIIGPRGLTKGLDLGGRVFMNSYDHREDPSGRLLEVILTGPQLVAQWICMEHYFSTTAGEVYGSGSKVYHNVAGRVGVMTGLASDLRMGLARQTVMCGDRPYHEPMRLLTVIAAPRARIDALIARHQLLQNYYYNEWVHLVAWDPDDGRLYRYKPTAGWTQLAPNTPQLSLGKEPIA